MLTMEQARSWYPDGDPVHNFTHMVRVFNLAHQIAVAEGADLEIVRAAALLHDAQPSGVTDTPQRKDHHQTAAVFAGKMITEQGWSTERIDAVKYGDICEGRKLPDTERGTCAHAGQSIRF